MLHRSQLPQTLHRLCCDECGAVRMNTTDYSVCPNGHGRLHPKIPYSVERELQKRELATKLPWLLSLPGFRKWYADPYGPKWYKRLPVDTDDNYTHSVNGLPVLAIEQTPHPTLLPKLEKAFKEICNVGTQPQER